MIFKYKIILVIFIFSICSFFPFHSIQSQYLASNNIKKRKKQLEKLNKSIKNTRYKLNKLSKKEKSTLKQLQLTQQNRLAINKYLLVISEQLKELQKEIKEHDSLYYQLNSELRDIVTTYANISRQRYINQNTNILKYLLTNESTADDINQNIYFKNLTDYYTHNIKKINALRINISKETGWLKEKSDYQQELKILKTKEQRNLNYAINRNRKLLKKIKKDKNSLKKQLLQKKRSARKLKKIIADLIKKELQKSKKKYKRLPIGKISWPISSRKIFRHYGKVKNKETNTYFDNPGIDISAKNGTIVKSVARGEVSLIHWLPGYGTLVIINHGNGLRTVYANLSSVWVKKGERIKKGTNIGKTGESVDGEFLHFELWQGSKRLNPSYYLK